MKSFDKHEDFKLDLPRRPRRMRRTASLRAMAQETHVRVEDLIAPLIVKESGEKEPVGSMPGLFRLSIEDLVQECRELAALGIPAVAIFPNMDASLKDALGSEAGNPDTLTLKAVRAVKAEVPEISLITDVALDPYTTHGHDGVLNEEGSYVMNDETVRRLCEMAVLQAAAGVDIVAPSDMMDGRVGAIRAALDAAGYIDTAIMAYSAKFASAYYGPYREAVGSAKAALRPGSGPASGSYLGKETYQMNPANRREAIMDAMMDEDEGADFVMVKPAGAYLDIIRELRDASQVTVAAYQVSGEYAQIHAAAKLGWLDYEKTRDESLLAIKRAGADVVLTYFAKEVATKLRG